MDQYPVAKRPKLLPKPASSQQSTSKEVIQTPTQEVPTPVACNTCRGRKVKCDGGRPKCKRCLKRGDDCVYASENILETRAMVRQREISSMSKKVKDLEQLITFMRMCPPDHTQKLLQQLGPIAGPQFYQRLTEISLSSLHLDGQSASEFSFTVVHPWAYPSAQNMSIPSETHRIQTSGSRRNSETPDHHRGGTSATSNSSSVNLHLCDPRLGKLQIGFWTGVSVTNEYAANAISLYLEDNHPVYALFDIDLFLDSLVGHNFEYCSPFLVSALLSVSSQTYSSRDPSAHQRSLEFEAEAETLAKTSSLSDPTLRIPSLMLLYLSVSGRGARDALKYLQEVVSLGTQLGLFNVPAGHPEDTSPSSSTTDDRRRFLSCAAWGAFSMITSTSLLTEQNHIEVPPKLPIPTQGDSVPALPFMGKTFPYMCNLNVVIVDILQFTCSYRFQFSVAFAISLFHRLLQLVQSLPSDMQHNRDSSGPVLVTHIFFHVTVMELFQPFNKQVPQFEVKGFGPRSTTPREICEASLTQLRQLVLDVRYLSRLSVDLRFSLPVFMHVASAALAETEDPSWRYYFLQCLDGLRDISRTVAVSEGIAQGLLVLAVKKGVITSQDSHVLSQGFQKGHHFGKPLKRYEGYFYIDRSRTDKGVSDLRNLTEAFQEMAVEQLFAEFTNDHS